MSVILHALSFLSLLKIKGPHIQYMTMNQKISQNTANIDTLNVSDTRSCIATVCTVYSGIARARAGRPQSEEVGHDHV